MNLVERVKRILLSPQTEWEVIATEQTTPAELYTRYIIPLAAIGPVAQFIGYSVFGIRVFGSTYRVPIGSGLTTAIVTFILTLGATYLLAMIIDALAPTFGGQRSQIQALKVAAYSSTAAWVAGIFALIPGLRVLGILGLYSLYLLYLGLPSLMKTPRDRALAYTGVVVIAGIVLFMVVSIIANRFLSTPGAGMSMP
ncbi:MAG TPA: Yip1 family protein [Gemmatimonadales bacterium]|nr:Yip1 family protein [Gemmatimonadales bacterium]